MAWNKVLLTACASWGHSIAITTPSSEVGGVSKFQYVKLWNTEETFTILS